MAHSAMNAHTIERSHSEEETRYMRRFRRFNKRFRKQNVGTLDRIFRVALGAALIGSVFYLDESVFAQTNWWVLLPLLGIYPALTAVLGWDPVLDAKHVTSETNIPGDFPGSVKEQVEHAVDAAKHEYEHHKDAA